MPACAMRYDGQSPIASPSKRTSPRCVRQHADDAFHRRRLAHAVATEQRDALARLGGERHAEQHLARAVVRGQVGDFERAASPGPTARPRSWSPGTRRALRGWRGSPRVAARDDAAVHQHRDAVGELEHRVHVVLDQQDAVAALERCEQRDQALRFGEAHARHRLVEQQQLRLRGERHRHFELPPLAVRQRCDRHVGLGSRGRLASSASRACATSAASAASGRQNEKLCPACACTASMTLISTLNSGNTDVIWYERPMPSSARRYTGSCVMSRPSKRMLPASGTSSPDELVDQRRLAGAVGADHRVHFARLDGEVDAVGRGEAAEALDETRRPRAASCAAHGALPRAARRARRGSRTVPFFAVSTISTIAGPEHDHPVRRPPGQDLLEDRAAPPRRPPGRRPCPCRPARSSR